MGLILLGVKGGLSSGGVGTCRIGRGGAFVVRGSVTPGMDGMSGGSERLSAMEIRYAIEATEYFILEAHARMRNKRERLNILAFF